MTFPHYSAPLRRRDLLVRMAQGVAILGLAGCTVPRAPTPASTATQEPATLPQAAPVVTPSAQTSAADWSQVLLAANQEGAVVLWGQGTAGAEAAFATAFEQRYPDIQVDYEGATLPEHTAKLMAERQAGQHTVDVYIHGATDLFGTLIPAGAVDPLPPYLVGPDDTDGSVWLGGGFNYTDDAGKYDIVFTGGVQPPIAYNTTLASPSDFPSLRNLLDPKWQGKIAMLDPRVGGAGLGVATFWYLTPSLGSAFITQLFTTQGVALTRDPEELSNWIGHGQYAVSVGISTFNELKLQAAGAPIGLIPADSIQEGSYLSGSFGTVAVINEAPHPNATKVYLNWLLSQEGQEMAASVTNYPSRRLDVPTTGIPDIVVPKAGVHYLDSTQESYVRPQLSEVVPLLASLLPS